MEPNHQGQVASSGSTWGTTGPQAHQGLGTGSAGAISERQSQRGSDSALQSTFPGPVYCFYLLLWKLPILTWSTEIWSAVFCFCCWDLTSLRIPMAILATHLLPSHSHFTIGAYMQQPDSWVEPVRKGGREMEDQPISQMKTVRHNWVVQCHPRSNGRAGVRALNQWLLARVILCLQWL